MKNKNFPGTFTSVPNFCYGTGALPRYENDPSLLIYAFNKGINFWDTADQYGTHEVVSKALEAVERENIVLQTKTLAFTKKESEKDIKRFLRELKTTYIDGVLLHHVSTVDEWKKRQGAWRVLKKYKKKGTIKSIGFSTHSSPELVNQAGKDVDVILASINELYIEHGTLKEMLSALKKQHKEGKVILGMKLLGAGKHVKEYDQRIKFAKSLKFVDSYLLGMKNKTHIRKALAYF